MPAAQAPPDHAAQGHDHPTTGKGHEGHGPATGLSAYACPMHPDVVSSEPGKCPRCGMNLTERK
jgi:hypothetical protein